MNRTLSEFNEQLASKAATPGGGGACGLVGSLAASLGCMVGNLTVGKKKYVDVEEEVKQLMEACYKMQENLLNSIQEDAECFLPLSQAYSLPKEDPNRDETLEKCLALAASAPFKIMQLCCQTIDLLERLSQIGSKLVISDAATGAMLAHGALYGASINVKVNTKLMKNKAYALDLEKQVENMLNTYGNKALSIYDDVSKRL